MAIKIALAGNPNCGKTTMFNALTGANQYVGNWPGVTVEKKHGKKVACHCHSRQGMEMLVKAGADSVEHSTYLDADVDKLLIENGV